MLAFQGFGHLDMGLMSNLEEMLLTKCRHLMVRTRDQCFTGFAMFSS